MEQDYRPRKEKKIIFTLKVVRAHPSATHVHVGCDEVFHLGECAECAGRNRNEIFVEHVTAVARYVRQAHNR